MHTILDSYHAIQTWGEWLAFNDQWGGHDLYTMTRCVADHAQPQQAPLVMEGHCAGWPQWSDLIDQIDYHQRLKTSQSLGRRLPEFDQLTGITGLREACVALGFDDDHTLDITIHVQQPGHIMKLHVDNIVICHLDHQWHSHAFDPVMRQPQGTLPVHRWFVALADWSPGQSFQFGDAVWSHWRCGDVASFDWRTTSHGSANYGYSARPMLRITGTRSQPTHSAEWRWPGVSPHRP